MKVARIGNLFQPIPAIEYGGTQRSMAQMTAFQAALCAHDITLYASDDSEIIAFSQNISDKLGLSSRVDLSGKSISIRNEDGHMGRIILKSCGISSIGYEDPGEKEKHDRLFSELVRDEKEKPFDLIHCHNRALMAGHIIPQGLFPKTLVHQHNISLERSYADYAYPIICISEDQAKRMRKKYKANVYAVIYHGLDSFAYAPTTESAGYLAWIGRFLKEKGAHRAIDIAREAGRPLVIAGLVYEKKRDSITHFNEDILPLVDIHDPTFLDRTVGMTASEVRQEIEEMGKRTGKKNPVLFCGPANERQKQALYGHAAATLFPISWAEPFGRVMIESMACGTPVIGYESLGDDKCGSVAEVIENGATGFLLSPRDESDGIRMAAEAAVKIGDLDRRRVRAVFERDWTSERVARQLDETYRAFLERPPRPLDLRGRREKECFL